MHERSVAEIDFDALTEGRKFHPSPDAWEDEILYFLLVDRFSDGRENGYKDNAGKFVRDGVTPLIDGAQDRDNALRTPRTAALWRSAGNGWVGGTLAGLHSKLGYLHRLGVTTIWMSPVLKQCVYSKGTYHGYGTQNFLEIDPHFGTREDLRDLVADAHGRGLNVVLDVILNHTGDVFAYDPDRYPRKTTRGWTYMDARWDGREYAVKGFRDSEGKPTLPFNPVDVAQTPNADDSAVWPSELQHPDAFHRKGHIVGWDHTPEYLEGDFFGLKDLNLGEDKPEGGFAPSAALEALCAAYKFWIAYADLDGFRVDTVKHMGLGAVRYFCEQIHAFAQSIGKRNFYLIGEIAGGRANAFRTLRDTCLDAALGVDEIPSRLRDVIAGRCAAHTYFQMFTNAPDIASQDAESDDPDWPRHRVVTFFDDHDQIGRKVKGRLAAEYADRDHAHRATIAALGLNLTTTGIPCVYYGTEQALDGHALDERGDERYVREAMFGGKFGAFVSRDRHCFDEHSVVYRELARIARLRAEHESLRRGAQYLRPVRNDGDSDFAYPEECASGGKYDGLVAWSRILKNDEIVCVLNTDFAHSRAALVTVDSSLHPPGSKPLRCLYSTTDHAQIDTATGVPEPDNGSAVCITLPPGGFAVFQ